MPAPDTPLFVKTHDFLLWLIQRTQRFPKNLRQSYTLKLETAAFEFQEAILVWRRHGHTARNHDIAKGVACLRGRGESHRYSARRLAAREV